MIPRSDLIGNSQDGIRRLVDGGLDLAPGQSSLNELRKVLLTLTSGARVRIVRRTGWFGSTFILPHRVIGRTEEAVYFEGGRVGAHFAERGSLEAWKKLAVLASGNPRLIFAISVAFSGPIIDLLEEPGTGFHYRGRSSIGKTVLLIAAGSVWGGGGPQGFVGSWRATANGLEGIAAIHSGTVLILDELAEIDPREAGAAVYSLANGSGKARSGRAGEARTRLEWRVQILSTGEIALPDKIAETGRKGRAGLDVRLIDIEADAGVGFGVFNDLHGRPDGAELANEVRNLAITVYGTAGPAFVQMLSEQVEEVRQAARKQVERFTNDLVVGDQSDGQIVRVARRFAVVAVTGEMARVALGLPWKEDEAFAAAKQLFDEWRSRRGGTEAAELIGAFQMIRATVERHGPTRFDDYRSGARAGLPSRDRLGYRVKIEGVECWAFTTSGWDEILTGIADPKFIGKEMLKRRLLVVHPSDKSWQTNVKIRVPVRLDRG